MFVLPARFRSFLARRRSEVQRARKAKPSFRRAGVELLEQRRLLATFLVNSFDDTVDAIPGDTIAADASGNCTLRAAVMEANARAGDDTILLPAGTFTFSLAGIDEDTATIGDLDVTDKAGALTITGAGAGPTIIAPAGGLDRAFDVHSEAALNLSGVTISGGGRSDLGYFFGGSIRVTYGTLNVTDSVLSEGLARVGGGIGNQNGTVTLVNSMILGGGESPATWSGGGIHTSSGKVTVDRSTISGGYGGTGGGIYSSGGLLTVTNSTISGNESSRGGGIFSYSPLTVTNSTISGNTATLEGGGIYSYQDPVELSSTTITQNTAGTGGGIFNDMGTAARNSIIAGNTAASGGRDVAGLFTSRGHNLIGDAGTVTGFVHGTNGDLVGSTAGPIDPLLAPLADNGGPTRTHGLRVGSPAMDAGDNSAAAATDQRGFLRVADGQRDGTVIMDIGAFERSEPTGVLPSDILLDRCAVEERSPNGTVVGSLSAADLDPGDTHTFALQDNAGGRFALSGNRIVVADGALLDYMQAGRHQVVVRAIDSEGLFFDKALDIAVTQIQDTKRVFNASHGGWTSYDGKHYVTGYGQVGYLDTNRSFFSFDISSLVGQDLLAIDFGFRRAEAWNFDGSVPVSMDLWQVTASPSILHVQHDSGSDTGLAIFRSLGGGLYQWPSGSSDRYGRVDVRASDDPNYTVGLGANTIYHLQQAIDGGQQYFSIGMAHQYDHESEVIVPRDGSLTVTVDVTVPRVDIVDVRPDPRNGGLAQVQIFFSEAVSGFDLSDLTLTRDGGPNLLTAAQTLTTTNNIVWTLGNVPALTGPSGTYALTLSAAGSGIVDRVGIPLAVGDADSWQTNNSAFGDITLSNNAVSENSGYGAAVGSLSATDPGDIHTFTLVDDAGGRFRVSENQLQVLNGGLLDFEAGAAYQVAVRATDTAGNTVEKAFTLAVTDVNELPTDLALSPGSVTENSANGTVVGSVSALDPDVGDSHTYALLNNAGGRFALSGSQLVVANGSLLNFESAASHPVTVRATDSGGLTFDKTLTVAVSQSITDLGEIDYWNSGAVSPRAGSLNYSFEAAHDGILSAELRQGAAAGTEMRLYALSPTGQRIDPPLAIAQQRVDLGTASAGARYLLTIAGLDSSAEVRLANLVERSGSGVTVYGTTGDDGLVFDASSALRIEVNGVVYDVAGMNTLVFDGAGGSDHLRFLGSAAAEAAQLRPRQALLRGEGYTVVAANIESSEFDGGGGSDAARLYGSRHGNALTAGGDALGANSRYATITGGGVSISATAARIYADGLGGKNTAVFYESAAGDSFQSFWKSARMSGNDYAREVRGFAVARESISPAALAQALWLSSTESQQRVKKQGATDLGYIDQLFAEWQ